MKHFLWNRMALKYMSRKYFYLAYLIKWVNREPTTSISEIQSKRIVYLFSEGTRKERKKNYTRSYTENISSKHLGTKRFVTLDETDLCIYMFIYTEYVLRDLMALHSLKEGMHGNSKVETDFLV